MLQTGERNMTFLRQYCEFVVIDINSRVNWSGLRYPFKNLANQFLSSIEALTINLIY